MGIPEVPNFDTRCPTYLAGGGPKLFSPVPLPVWGGGGGSGRPDVTLPRSHTPPPHEKKIKKIFFKKVGGTPLAVTQEDCLVRLKFSDIYAKPWSLRG